MVLLLVSPEVILEAALPTHQLGLGGLQWPLCLVWALVPVDRTPRMPGPVFVGLFGPQHLLHGRASLGQNKWEFVQGAPTRALAPLQVLC